MEAALGLPSSQYAPQTPPQLSPAQRMGMFMEAQQQQQQQQVGAPGNSTTRGAINPVLQSIFSASAAGADNGGTFKGNGASANYSKPGASGDWGESWPGQASTPQPSGQADGYIAPVNSYDSRPIISSYSKPNPITTGHASTRTPAESMGLFSTPAPAPDTRTWATTKSPVTKSVVPTPAPVAVPTPGQIDVTKPGFGVDVLNSKMFLAVQYASYGMGKGVPAPPVPGQVKAPVPVAPAVVKPPVVKPPVKAPTPARVTAPTPGATKQPTAQDLHRFNVGL